MKLRLPGLKGEGVKQWQALARDLSCPWCQEPWLSRKQASKTQSCQSSTWRGLRALTVSKPPWSFQPASKAHWKPQLAIITTRKLSFRSRTPELALEQAPLGHLTGQQGQRHWTNRKRQLPARVLTRRQPLERCQLRGKRRLELKSWVKSECS